jgi:glutamyl/glutaminyl-tRNA synthetase
MLDQQGQRLAKRHDALSLRSLREQGRKPEHLLAGMHITDRFSLPPE